MSVGPQLRRSVSFIDNASSNAHLIQQQKVEDEAVAAELLLRFHQQHDAGGRKRSPPRGGRSSLLSSTSDLHLKHRPSGGIPFGPVGGPRAEFARLRHMAALRTQRNREAAMAARVPLNPSIAVLSKSSNLPHIKFSTAPQFEPALPWASSTPLHKELQRDNGSLPPVRVPHMKEVVEAARVAGKLQAEGRKRAAREYQRARPDVFSKSRNLEVQEMNLSHFHSFDTELNEQERRAKDDIAEYVAEKKRERDVAVSTKKRGASGGRSNNNNNSDNYNYTSNSSNSANSNVNRPKKYYFLGKLLSAQEAEAYRLAGIISDDPNNNSNNSNLVQVEGGDDDSPRATSGNNIKRWNDDSDAADDGVVQQQRQQQRQHCRRHQRKSPTRHSAPRGAETPQPKSNATILSVVQQQLRTRSPLKSRTPGHSIPRAIRAFITTDGHALDMSTSSSPVRSKDQLLSSPSASPSSVAGGASGETAGKFFSAVQSRRQKELLASMTCSRHPHTGAPRNPSYVAPRSPDNMMLGRVAGRKADTEHARLQRLAERLLTREHLEKCIQRSISDEDANAWQRNFVAELLGEEERREQEYSAARAAVVHSKDRPSIFDGEEEDPSDDLRSSPHGLMASPEHLNRLAAAQLRENLDLKRDDVAIRPVSFKAVDKHCRGGTSFFLGQSKSTGVSGCLLDGRSIVPARHELASYLADDPFQAKAREWEAEDASLGDGQQQNQQRRQKLKK